MILGIRVFRMNISDMNARSLFGNRVLRAFYPVPAGVSERFKRAHVWIGTVHHINDVKANHEVP